MTKPKYKIVVFTEVSCQWDDELNDYIFTNKNKLKDKYILDIINFSSINRNEYPDDVPCIMLELL